MGMVKRFALVLGATWLMGIPSALMSFRGGSGSPIYDALQVLAAALGGSIIPMLFAGVTLVAARDRRGNGIVPALVLAAIVSAFVANGLRGT
jgi:hypothetical protein